MTLEGQCWDVRNHPGGGEFHWLIVEARDKVKHIQGVRVEGRGPSGELWGALLRESWKYWF